MWVCGVCISMEAVRTPSILGPIPILRNTQRTLIFVEVSLAEIDKMVEEASIFETTRGP